MSMPGNRAFRSPGVRGGHRPVHRVDGHSVRDASAAVSSQLGGGLGEALFWGSSVRRNGRTSSPRRLGREGLVEGSAEDPSEAAPDLVEEAAVQVGETCPNAAPRSPARQSSARVAGPRLQPHEVEP